MTDQAIGERIIHAIVDGRLLSSECPAAPGEAVLHMWRENAAEQIGRVAIAAGVVSVDGAGVDETKLPTVTP